MKRLGLILLMLLTGCTQAQPELRETKEVQTSIPYSDEELIESANDQIEDEAYYVDSITQQSDTVIGMSEEFLPSLFELFTRERNTTLSKIPGTGLGMAIVKNLVDLMNGSIEVESELGKGSTFTITIPHKIANKDYTNRNIESSH